MWKKSLITRKMKIGKLIFHSFQNTVCLGPKNENGSFWRRGEQGTVNGDFHMKIYIGHFTMESVYILKCIPISKTVRTGNRIIRWFSTPSDKLFYIPKWSEMSVRRALVLRWDSWIKLRHIWSITVAEWLESLVCEWQNTKYVNSLNYARVYIT